ncbi:MAG: hypothetical protein JW818_04375, partial [Pirellulales bacterium]|nr:hypothetical protein [Pirellulales bacterium]
LDGPADWTVGRVESNGGRYRFDVVRRGEAVCRVGLTMPGRHNVLNALAAAALCWHQGVRPDQIGMALSLFPGLHRRQEVLGDKGGVLWMDDYAHHPTEVRVTLATVRQMAPGRRLLCVFQPHQASRTRRLLDELAESLHNVDMLWIASIFRAREGAPRPGEATSAELAECVRQHGTLVSRVHDWQDIVSEVSKSLLPGDVFITIGAGDIRRMADELHERIRTVRAAG